MLRRRHYLLALVSLPFVRLGWVKPMVIDDQRLVLRSGWVLKKGDE